jgi:SAM-dependent methyltransferase
MELKPVPASALDAAALRNWLEPLFGRCFSHDLERAYSHVDRLCLNLCFHIVHECGLLNCHSEPLAGVIARAGVAPEAVYLLETVFEILAGEGFAEHNDDGWKQRRPCLADESARLQREARAACPRASPIFELIERCHDRAPTFLTGREPGLTAIFPRADLELWERVHTADHVMSIYADLVTPVLEAIAENPISVLEVGAGVGAVAQRCPPLLQKLGVREYWFTDLGKLFVQRARDIYAGDMGMHFAALDLDRPFAEQGFLPERFDVVIAVNVLHVARNLCFTLREIHRALKPRGWLIFAEGSPPSRVRRWRPDVVFAFLRGWWDVAIDPLLRPQPGLLFPNEWKNALLACGYDSVHLLPGEDWFRTSCRGGVVLAGKETREPVVELLTCSAEDLWAT